MWQTWASGGDGGWRRAGEAGWDHRAVRGLQLSHQPRQRSGNISRWLSGEPPTAPLPGHGTGGQRGRSCPSSATLHGASDTSPHCLVPQFPYQGAVNVPSSCQVGQGARIPSWDILVAAGQLRPHPAPTLTAPPLPFPKTHNTASSCGNRIGGRVGGRDSLQVVSGEPQAQVSGKAALGWALLGWGSSQLWPTQARFPFSGGPYETAQTRSQEPANALAWERPGQEVLRAAGPRREMLGASDTRSAPTPAAPAKSPCPLQHDTPFLPPSPQPPGFS